VQDQVGAVPGFTASNENLKTLHILRMFNFNKIWSRKPTDLDINREYVAEILRMVE
jgi:hypothetical protein